MPTVLTLARLLALIALMVGVVGTSRGPAFETAALEAPAPTVLGDGSCGLEDDEDTLVLCGREVFADLIDTSWLVLPKGQCTDLFGDLSARQLCAFDDPDCDRASPAAPAPPLPQMQVSSSPTPTLLVRADARASASLRAWPSSADDALPASSVLSPPRATAPRRARVVAVEPAAAGSRAHSRSGETWIHASGPGGDRKVSSATGRSQ